MLALPPLRSSMPLLCVGCGEVGWDQRVVTAFVRVTIAGKGNVATKKVIVCPSKKAARSHSQKENENERDGRGMIL